ncbi:MAG TPA: translocation/assembly module TamB domain-containing protein [Stellaceae bacterium]|nr:translocation/assembly module TamB domain-containing protein [Stellaceae bacterium]
MQRPLRLALLGFAGVLAALLAILAGAYLFMQTGTGKRWLAAELGRLLSSPETTVTVRDLAGAPPFDLRAGEIRVADREGPWLVVRDAHLAVAAGALLRGELVIPTLRADTVEVTRLPEASRSGAPPASAAPLRIELPRLPLGVRVDEIAVGRLMLDEPVPGEAATLTFDGAARIEAARASARLSLRRIDQTPGAASLALTLAGAPARLDLDAEASEPTGVLMDRLLQRKDHPPLAIALRGSGPVADWHGRLTGSIGTLLSGDAALGIREDAGWHLSLQGQTKQAGLLPPAIEPLVGDRVDFDARATLAPGDVLTVDRLELRAAAATLSATLRLDQATQAIAGTAHVAVPDLAPATGLVGAPLAGRIGLDASLGGTVQQPTAALRLAGTGARLDTLAIERLGADLSLAARGGGRWQVDGHGELAGLSLASRGLPAGIGNAMDWTLSSVVDPDRRALELEGLTITGGGLDLAAAGHLSPAASDGTLQLRVADLGLYGGLVGVPGLRGRVALDGALASDADGKTTLTLRGGTEDLSTGVAAADALLGQHVAIKADAARSGDGDLDLSSLSVAGAAAALDVSGSVSAGGDRLAGKLALTVPKLAPLQAALGTPVRGDLRLNAELGGGLQHPSLAAHLLGRDLGGKEVLIRSLASEIAVGDLARPDGTLTADIDAAELRGRVEARFSRPSPDRLSLSRLVATAAGARLDGRIDYSRASGLASGRLTGKVADLQPWSRLAGTPLAGRADLALTLGAGGGQTAELTLNGDDLAAGAGAQAIRVARLAIAGKGTSLESGHPRGSATVDATGLGAGTLALASVHVEAASGAGDTIGFQGDARGDIRPPGVAADRRGLPASLSLAGDWTRSRTGEQIVLTRLAGKLDKDTATLRQPLRLVVGTRDYRIENLALDIAGGALRGNAALTGNDIVLKLAADRLPLAPFGRLAGRSVGGTLDASADVSGPVAAPQGEIKIDGRDLHLAGAQTAGLPPVRVDLEIVPHDGQLDLRGVVASHDGELLHVRGTVPVRITAEPPSVTVPENQRMALAIDGDGKLETIAELLPIGEDRVAGHYQLALTVGGTLDAPVTGGRFTVDGGYYQNQAFGTELRNLNAELVGDLSRLRLVRLEADDGAAGKLTAAGTVDLAASGSLDLQAQLVRFLVARTDEARAIADADVHLDGTLSAPRLVARIQVPHGDFRIPDRLPPSVVKLNVIEVDHGQPVEAPPVAASPALPIALDVKLEIPGQTFVRGRGLDSEWRGSLAITGTAGAPAISGGLQAVHGTLSLLGKDFVIRRGTINFPGGTLIDPQIDLLAEYSAADITAQIRLTGSASAPRLTLTSEPRVSQDQILSRVLFGRDASQITPSQGLQLAYAASTLAGGGPDVLDRLRTATGLDRLSFGSGSNTGTLGGTTTAGSASASSSAAAPTVSGGKYVAPGVFVGVEQGASAQSTRSQVEVEITPHITAQSSVGVDGSSRVGLDWRYDY